MIIANISGEKFALASLKAPELLLQILERATPCRSTHLEPDYREVHIRTEHFREMGIGIVAGDLLSEAEYTEAKAKEDAARAARLAAANKAEA